ncbi:MAG: hypothetical protein HQM14_19955 [SAR324 cluster bacterium]|nr:hypothetical protein [SAR324 cluster bacterium]
MRYSSRFVVVCLVFALLAAVEYWDYQLRVEQYNQTIWMRDNLQSAVGLPNLAITTAARYLRHYSLADLSSPFQDYPTSFDHFPAGFAFAVPDYSETPTPIRIKGFENLQY